MRLALQWVAAAAGYYALAWFSAQAGFVHDGVPVILLAQGVAFSAVQLGGPWLATAVAVGAAGEGFREGLPIGAVLLLAAAAASAGLAAYAVTRLARLRTSGERIADTLIRTGGATAAGIAAASFGLGADAVVGRVSTSPAEDWAVLLLANVAGIFVIAPFLRAWAERRSSGVARLREWLALVAVAIGLSTVVDAAVLGATGSSAYVVFPVVV